MKATFIRHGGDDLDVVNAARVSFSKKSEWEVIKVPTPKYQSYIDRGLEVFGSIEYEEKRALKQSDVNLIHYLARGVTKAEWEKIIIDLTRSTDNDYDTVENVVTSLMNMAQHWVPFTHNMVSLHMVAPIPIARQCFKHKVGFTESEESRRYISHIPTLYVPEEFRSKAANVKQGSGGKHKDSDSLIAVYVEQCEQAIETYELLISRGISPEQARFVLPQGVEVEWRWTGNIAAFARYVNQRSDSHAQLESQILAKQVSDIIQPLFPVSWDALVKSGRTDE